MKIKHPVIYLLTTLLALIAPLSAMAFDLQSLTSANIFTPPVTDKSMAYLSQLFGSVGDVLQGSSGQLLGQLLGILNYGVVILASAMMTYTVILSVINTAQEGEFMGRNMKSAWVLIRSVVGIGLLVPQATGYSLAQVIVMWAVVQGIGFADQGWEKSLNYLADRGGVYSQPPVESSTDKTLQLAGQVFVSQVCTYQLQNLYQNARGKMLEEYRKHPTDDLKKTLNLPAPQFGYFVDTNAKTTSFGFKTDNKQMNEQTMGVCGVYNWNWMVSTENKEQTASMAASGTEMLERVDNYTKAALDQMILDLAPTAKRIATAKKAEDSKTFDNVNQGVESLVKATLDYENLATPLLDKDQQAAWRDRNGKIQKAKDQGWIAAGSYYRMIAGFGTGISGAKYLPVQVKAPPIAANDVANQPEANKINLKDAFNNIAIIETAASEFNSPSLEENVNSYLEAIRMAFLYLTGQAADGTPAKDKDGKILPTPSGKLYELYHTKAQDAGANKIDIASVGIGLTDENKLAKDSAKWEKAMDNIPKVANLWAGGPVVGGMGQLILNQLKGITKDDWLRIMKEDNKDGIQKVQALGESVMKRAIDLWTKGTGVAFGLTTALTIAATGAAMGSIFSGFGAVAANVAMGAIEAALKFAAPFLNIVVLALLTNGLVLAVYIPLIPFLVFAFAAIGWFISVLEAMVAAPLVALGITHPEGHDLMGKAEQAVMLLLSVFLRPILMIIGLVAGILLSWVAIKIINLGFEDVITSNGFLGTNGMLSAMQVIGVIIIYTIIIISVINTSFSLIHVIPQKVMNWVGLHPEGSNIEGMLHEIKGGTHSTGQSIGQPLQQGSDKAAGSSRPQIQDKEKDKKPGLGVGNDGGSDGATPAK